MSGFFLGVFVLLLVTGLAVLGRLLRVATPVDRMLSASLAGSLLVALLLLLAQVAGVPVLEDVALVLAVLGAVAVSTFASRPQVQDARPQVVRERAR
jgi:multicomponent Na+:H+ antiporter subunit F